MTQAHASNSPVIPSESSIWEQFVDSQYLFAGNELFIEDMYKLYREDPAQVDAEWRAFFGSLSGSQIMPRASWVEDHSGVVGVLDPEEKKEIAKKEKQIVAQDDTAILHSIRALQLIHAYRVRGHLKANLDPLAQPENKDRSHPELNPMSYGFVREDYTKEIYLGGTLGKQSATLNEIISILDRTYCQTIGVEFMHIQYPEQKHWIQQRFEQMQGKPHINPQSKKDILRELIEVDAFEEFLHTKYPGMKRFSVQGGDAMLPGMQEVIHVASRLGVEEVIVGMPHRGRMNVLTNIMKKPYVEMFSLFHGNADFPEWVNSSGDVKYHIGVSADRPMPHDKSLHLSLTANPSHLEAVNPVVCGKVRAKMDQRGDTEKRSVLGILLHGDAAFAGQGIVPETLSLSELRGYRTGGTLHIIVNNQIGFTTSPKYSRFTPYPSDVAKMVQAPIFHVNGEDPEAVVYACRLATEFRQEFGRDVVIDIFCYRKYGHNEGDEPMFTQPQMYQAIRQKKSPARMYADVLISQGTVTEQDVQAEYAQFNSYFEQQFDAGKNYKPNKADWLGGAWSNLAEAEEASKRTTPDTGVDVDVLRDLAAQMAEIPQGFNVNSKLKRIIETRTKAVLDGKEIDWAMGEHLGFATLLREGYPVRLTGQDSCRGTFSHRHAVLVDQITEERYTPLNNLKGVEKHIEVVDSSLSEFAILGFEYGYSQAEPNALTLWEAQFGDFCNGAQIMIDQFIASGEIKWLRMSGLVMLLPHGYEGQGPEHSSARLERFLQLCGQENMQVVNCTTPANFFHVLRRQLHRNFRKPLIVMTPKSLLRHKRAVSTIEDFAPGTRFEKVYGEQYPLKEDAKIRKVLITSGKVYYDLLQFRDDRGIDDVAIIRLEQYYPFPHNQLKAVVQRYPNASIAWVQEEPKNMGAWTFVAPYIEDVLLDIGRSDRPAYVGRVMAASPAAGYLKIHNREQQELVLSAFDVTT
ncbi:MAG: 2-oxoglutarate dehydrogenase E1 component [Alphaproteobacteria bacterium]|nr:MAG: 2-oxoglutarate dehydrogenase E1 component [Alphaproteobacteria bacterium]TAF16055.1 MAG: 2-oxoglutarate dehydrogenase E1 component [Alphaproteobacteria bacterium]TAF40643.1 MAG: 2-oxoglutarate dehydrogenase E1 component [Alphaproteobacteria bacterium]TAF75937.1 MAG: 2-oxoglutarate dehydrogenase E1 component [Alphaproteobacteria bacterium]